jgi:hypothetical protein
MVVPAFKLDVAKVKNMWKSNASLFFAGLPGHRFYGSENPA